MFRMTTECLNWSDTLLLEHGDLAHCFLFHGLRHKDLFLTLWEWNIYSIIFSLFYFYRLYIYILLNSIRCNNSIRYFQPESMFDIILFNLPKKPFYHFTEKYVAIYSYCWILPKMPKLIKITAWFITLNITRHDELALFFNKRYHGCMVSASNFHFTRNIFRWLKLR